LLGSVAAARTRLREGPRTRKGCETVKKLLLLAIVAIGVAAVWRKILADRAELDLWTEATTADD
jgi:hypothetical protein